MQQRCASLLAGKRTAYTRIGTLIVVLLICGLPSLAMAQDAAAPDSGNTAWMLTSTALVLFMTIPGLALFYGGLVRVQNVLSVLMQCFALTGLMTILWVICGYSLAFNTAGMEAGKITLGSFVGGLGTMFLRGVGVDSLTGDIPETVFITFQMTFAIITPALIAGAFAERMKFSAMLIFSVLWSIVVYAPLCHMAWSGPPVPYLVILSAHSTSQAETLCISTQESPHSSLLSWSGNGSDTVPRLCRPIV